MSLKPKVVDRSEILYYDSTAVSGSDDKFPGGEAVSAVAGPSNPPLNSRIRSTTSSTKKDEALGGGPEFACDDQGAAVLRPGACTAGTRALAQLFVGL